MARFVPACVLVLAASGVAAAKPTVVAYAHPAVCFDSTVTVFHNRDFDDGGDRDDVTFTYAHARVTSSVPIEVGAKLAPRTIYNLCVTLNDLHDAKPDSEPLAELIEVRRGTRLVWAHSYELSITQELAWTKDGALLVDLGQDDVYATPFPRHLKPIAVTVPAAVARADDSGVRTFVVRITERRDGAHVEIAKALD